jgi:hypothetical protein
VTATVTAAAVVEEAIGRGALAIGIPYNTGLPRQ